MIRPRASQTAAAVADHYDELDPLYRDLWGEDVHHGLWRTGRESVMEAVTALSELVGRTLDFGPSDALVDIGCGYGGTAGVLPHKVRSLPAFRSPPRRSRMSGRVKA